MNKFQNVKFHNLNELFEFLPKEELDITLFLRDIILKEIPNIREKLSYNVPFYSLNKSISYIWPGSVPWGTTRDGVQIGLHQARKINLKEDYFQFENRKQIAAKTILSIEDIDVDLIRYYLQESVKVM